MRDRGWLRFATSAMLATLLLTGCGGSDAGRPASHAPADRTQRTDAGARETLHEYAIAFTATDAKRICDLLDPASPALRSLSKQRCERQAARLKGVLTPVVAAQYRQRFAGLRPVVKGNVATLPGNTQLSLRYAGGRWYVRLAPSGSSTPAS